MCKFLKNPSGPLNATTLSLPFHNLGIFQNLPKTDCKLELSWQSVNSQMGPVGPWWFSSLPSNKVFSNQCLCVMSVSSFLWLQCQICVETHWDGDITFCVHGNVKSFTHHTVTEQIHRTCWLWWHTHAANA